MSDTSSGPDLFDALAHEFAERFRRGERPALSEYTDRYPELADEIRELFPALVAMEEFDSEVRPGAGPFDPGASTAPRVLGDYRVIREIGRGGMGIVYEAVQESLGRHVALKVLTDRPSLTPNQLARFIREAKAAAGLHHTNIVPVFGVGEHEGFHFYAMQFIEGQGLDAVLAEVKRLRRGAAPGLPVDIRSDEPLATEVARGLLTGRFEEIGLPDVPARGATADGGSLQGVSDHGANTASGAAVGSTTSILGMIEGHYHRSVARLGVQVAEALTYAHTHGVLHRDIKPANLLLDLQGAAWVTDFGLAKAEGSDVLTSPGDIVGTLRYMAPERFRGQSDARSDIYSLGLTLYEMLTTEPAFAASDRAPLIELVRHAEPVRPRQLDPCIPRDLETIVRKAIAKDPDDRYQTADELAEDLRRFLGNRPILARSVGTMERAWRWCQRNPAPAGAIGTVAAALVFVAVISMVYAAEQANLLRESNRLLAIRNFDRGQAAFEKGEIGPGMLWMIESWRSAVDAGDPALQRVARVNLAHWRPHYPRLKMVLSHTRPIYGVAFSPDSRTVIVGSVDGTAQLWDVASGRKIGPLLRVGSQFPYFAFSPDGKSVLSVDDDHPVRFWDVTTGKPRGVPLPHRAHIISHSFKAEGKILLVENPKGTGYSTAQLWDPASGQPVGPLLKHQSQISGFAFSPDGKMILTGSRDGMARLWDAATGEPIGQPVRHPRGIRAVAFSPDGKMIFTGGLDGTAQLWHAVTRQPLGLPMQHESEVRAVAFSPDGRTVLTQCQDREARLWDTATGQFLGLLGHQGGISAVAYSPDGQTILTGSRDGTVRLWEADAGQPLGPVLEIPSTERVFGWSLESKVGVTFPQEPNHQRYIQLWNATTRKSIARLPQPGGNEIVKLSTNGKVLVTTEMNRTARLWNATTGVALGPAIPLPSRGLAVRLGPDGKAVLFSGEGNTVWMFDGITGAVRGRTPALRGTAYVLAFSPDGKTFLTGLANGDVQLWDAATVTPLGDPIPLGRGGAISEAGFSPDGKSLLIECEDGSLWLWDLATRQLLIPPIQHQVAFEGAAISPDCKMIATRRKKDRTVQLWDFATGRPIGPVVRNAYGIRDIRPELPDELERVATWVEVITGLRLEKQQGLIQVLDNAAWLACRERLLQLGGPPETGPEQRLDPILFGPEPTARARSFMELKQWDAADAAFDEAARARPFNISIAVERGDLYTKRGLWSEAAAYYSATVKQYPDVAPLHEQLAVTRLLAGDLPGYRAACAAMLERFKPIDDSTAAVRVAEACSLAPEAVIDLPGLIQVSERSTRWVASNERAVAAVRYRAGRLGEALERFENAHRVFQPRAWDLLFVAMIHSGLGHTSEARRVLDQADRWIDEADKAPPGTANEGRRWNTSIEKPVILLLRREAESVISADSSFPADPFARGETGDRAERAKTPIRANERKPRRRDESGHHCSPLNAPRFSRAFSPGAQAGKTTRGPVTAWPPSAMSLSGNREARRRPVATGPEPRSV
jgi:WD40 repeat protein/serine/threonine protein kinase/tetratricopeptide (TPR) repeat protein